MNSLQPFFEAFFSIHAILLLSSLGIGGNWLLKQANFKLRLARILFVCSMVAPIAILLVKQVEQPLFVSSLSLDSLPQYTSTKVLVQKSIPVLSSYSPKLLNVKVFDYWQLFLALYLLGVCVQGFRLLKDLRKLKQMLNSALPYLANGNLLVKVSGSCLIPFSVRGFKKAYIILPVSLLNSANNIKMAIAHEGQHHRQGDCLWAYYLEFVRIVFWGNPGVRRWRRILGELQELACDKALLHSQKFSTYSYGSCLYQVAQAASESVNLHSQEIPCTVGMAWYSRKPQSAFLTKRICLFSEYSNNYSRPFVLYVLLISVVIFPFFTAYSARNILFPAEGKEIQTSFLNPQIQQIATTEILAAVKLYRAKSGAIAVADPRTGKIIAFAEAGSALGFPSWKARLFAPGSTIKPFLAAAALEEKVASTDKNYACPNSSVIAGTTFTNAEPNIGVISLREAMVKSANTCLIKVAQEVGQGNLRKILTKFGFTTAKMQQYSKSDQLLLATTALGGETIPATIETLTNAYVILANKGHSLFASPSTEVVSESTATAVTSMLVDVVQRGTGKLAFLTKIQVAGKTGTLVVNSEADVGVSQVQPSTLALFGGYVPVESPQLVAFVVMENGHKINSTEMGSGGAIAAPVFKNVVEKSLSILNKIYQ